jgi:phosphoribosylaminoimidazole carboxylase (NCAIR synthetase)
MAARFAWVLNLDADLELAVPAYTPKASVREALRAFVPRVASSLLAPEDIVVDESSPAGSAAGLVGRAFCPTPRAIALLRRAGAEPEPHPPLPVLRRVNSRAFASALGATLPGAAFVTELDVARTMLAGAPPLGDGWRLKRAFGMTGRGQRNVRANEASDADLAFVRAALAEGGLQIEPNVAIVTEYAIHGMLAADGSFELGDVVEQRCDARGAWLATEPADATTSPEILEALRGEASRVAAALAAEGYFGPFGLDAFTYRDSHGTMQLQPRSEINARYTMGFRRTTSR